MIESFRDVTEPESEEEPASDELVASAIRTADSLLLQNEELTNDLRPLLDAYLTELAGPRLDTLLTSRDSTVAAAEDADPKIRRAAIYLLAEHWEVDRLTAMTCERIASADPSEDVRFSAIGAIGTCYARTKDRRINGLLAEWVAASELPDRLRIQAFNAMLRVHGYRDYTGPCERSIGSLDSIDWKFVSDYRVLQPTGV
jgi:hypothetical protein